jgi:hypothetical protein
MRIYTKTTNLFEVKKDSRLLHNLYSLTLRGLSEMRYNLNSVLAPTLAKQYIIILARIDNKVVGWSLLAPYLGLEQFYCAHFYVAIKYRRVGVGMALLKKAKIILDDINKKIITFPWDERSTNFFRVGGVIP